jgi:hypothetical protein
VGGCAGAVTIPKDLLGLALDYGLVQVGDGDPEVDKTVNLVCHLRNLAAQSVTSGEVKLGK